MKSKKLIKEIQKEMNYWYGFELTEVQVKEFLKDYGIIESFDTAEREYCGDFFGKKITGMEWPMNGDSDEYKDEFYKKLKENTEKLGYKINL